MLLMKRRVWVPLVLVALGALLIGIWAYFQPTPRRVAILCRDGLVTGDASAIWPYVPSDDAEEMGIDADTLQRLLQQYVVPTFSAFGDPTDWTDEQATQPPEGGWGAGVKYTKPDGSNVKLGVWAIPSQNGAMLYSFFPSLIMGTMAVRHKLDSDTNSYQWQVRGIEADAAILDHLGVHGLWVTERSESRFFTWGERLTVCKERARILEERAAASSGSRPAGD